MCTGGLRERKNERERDGWMDEREMESAGAEKRIFTWRHIGFISYILDPAGLQTLFMSSY